MSVEVKLDIYLTKLAKGKKVLNCKPGKISEIIQEITKKYPSFKKEILDENGNLKSYIFILLDEKNINIPGKDLFVKDNQKIKILIPLLGG
ncbi:MAG: MoaD/ThiS family protein [Actinobacteria bacterium]|nr:MoaD/ThiS family protein [Actinomycetota bacterium]